MLVRSERVSVRQFRAGFAVQYFPLRHPAYAAHGTAVSSRFKIWFDFGDTNSSGYFYTDLGKIKVLRGSLTEEGVITLFWDQNPGFHHLFVSYYYVGTLADWRSGGF